MRNLKIFLVMLIIFSLPSQTPAQNFGTTGATFLKLGVGTRAVGMGSAFTGISDDVNAMYWNPAGLGFIRSWELGLNYQKLYNDFEHYSLFYAHQFSGLFSKSISLGIGILHMGLLDSWDSTNGKMPPVSDADISDLAILIPLAYRLDFITDKLSIGVNYKYIQNKLAGYTSQSHGLDLGLLFKTDLTHRLAWSVGAAFRNKTLKKVKFIEMQEGLPYNMRFGTAVKFLIAENHDLVLSYDLAMPKDDNIKHNIGFEYLLNLAGHRLSFRGGYRMIDQDLGKLSFSVGYGVDISTLAHGTYYSEMNYSFNDYNNNILGNASMGGFIIRPTGLLPFKRLSPEMNASFKSRTEWILTWEKAADYDEHQRIKYFVLVDTSYSRLMKTIKNAKKFIKNISKGAGVPEVLFYKITPETKTFFSFKHENDTQDFYWAVIAYNRSLKIRVATGSDIIGKFTNRNLPDLIPVSLELEPVNFISDSKYQGILTGKVVGKIDQPFEVTIFDSTDLKVIQSESVPKLAQNDTFKISGKWFADNLGKHKICLISDYKNSIEERNEANNVLPVEINTVLYGKIAPQDTVKLEELRYEHIELPTIPYIFFEPNSTQFSKNSLTNNETEPDSLLKLFGQRLYRDYPGLKIVLKGYFDPSSEQAMINNTRLSFLRAKFVKNKLIEYGARESQIIISTSHDDRSPRLERSSRQIDPLELMMLNEENRRVEIQLPDNLPTTKRLEYDKRFFAPRLIIRKKNEILSQKIIFDCEINSSAPVDSLTIYIRDNKDDPFPIKIINYTSLPESEDVKLSIEWDGIKDNGLLIAFNKNFYYWIRIVDRDGKVYESPMRQFYVARSIIVKEKRIFALAKFNKVAPLHQFYLEQLDQVEAMMKKDPRIRVRFFGHTDVIGTEERNNKLSADRALELASWLAKIIDFDYSLTDDQKEALKQRIDNPLVAIPDNLEKIAYFGKGEHSPLVAKNIVYGDNNSPQGRTLNRRVDIEIYRKETFEKPPLGIEKNITFHPWYRFVTFPVYSEQDIPKLTSNEVFEDKSRFADNSRYFWRSPILLASTRNSVIFDENLSSAYQDTTIFDSTKVKADSLATDSTTTSLQTQDSLKTVEQISDSVKTTEIFVKDSAEVAEIDAFLLNRVRCIEFQDSLLWLGTDEGLLKWDTSTDTFSLFKIDFIKYKTFTALKYDPKLKVLYVGTHKGLRIFKDDKWIMDLNVWNGLSGNIINSILFLNDDQQSVLLATNEGIDILRKGRISIFANMDHGLTDDYVNSIYLDEKGKLWACTNQGICWQESDEKWVPFSGNDDLPSDTVKCFLIDDQGNKWVGTAEGLCMFDEENKRREFSTFDFLDDLRAQEIIDLVKDQTGKIWCITKTGLSMYKEGIWYTYKYEDGLPSNYMNAIRIDSDGKKYVGLHGGGVSIVK